MTAKATTKEAYSPAQIIDKKAIEALISDEDWQKLTQAEIKEEFNDLEKLRYQDIDWRLKNRENFRRFLIKLLVLQNIVVFTIFAFGMWFNKIAGLDAVFSTLVGGTLAETTALILIIVKWLFSEIPYQGKQI
jgi:hypothetical protein